MRVVFFGTPEFAVPSLRALLGEGFDVVTVVTRPDRPAARHRATLEPPPVKLVAEAEGIAVLQPERPTGPEFHADMRAVAPDIGVVAAYGHILEPALLAIPRRGMVNVHPSLLPALRGAAPVEWAILRGLHKTGVTIMQMDAGLDSGPILHQIPHHIDPDTTGGELREHLAEVGAQALVEALAMLEQDGLRPVAQDHSRATFAPKLTHELARLDWTAPADVVCRFTRGLDPRPGAWTTLEGGLEVKLFGGNVVTRSGAPGEVLAAGDELVVAAARDAVAVPDVQPAGKPRMSAGDWARGRGVRAGQRFG